MNPVLPMEWLLPLAAFAFAWTFFAGWRSTALAEPRLRIGLLLLRAFAIGVVILLALNPGRWKPVVVNDQAEWALLVDRSASMAVTDVEGRSRWQAAVEHARTAFQSETTPARVRLHTFARELETRIPDPAQLTRLTPDGGATDLLAPVAALFDQVDATGARLAGMFLVSDGRHLGADATEELGLRARALNAPLYALSLGGAVQRPDLAIRGVRRHYAAFANQPVTIGARVSARHLGDVRARVRLLDESGTVHAERQLEIADGAEVPVEFSYRATTGGYAQLRLDVEAWPGEALLHNNEARVGVSVLSSRIRVLFLEGSPHWDSKFLLQLLRRQPHVEIEAVHRVHEERFYRAGEEAAEVLFPESQAALDRYDAIALGKGAEYFLTPERAVMLQAFVRDRGGALLFCRGRPTEGDWPALDALDVADWGAPVPGPFRWLPTSAGEQAGLFDELLPAREDAFWPRMPPLAQAHAAVRLKPFTQVLAEGVPVEASGRRFPALLMRRIGKGIVLAVNSEGLWRYDFIASDEDVAGFYRTFWVAWLQWAVTQTDFLPGRDVAIRATPSTVRPGEPVKASIITRGTAAREFDEWEVQVRDLTRELPLQTTRASPARTGERAAILTFDEPGVYQVSVVHPDGDAEGSVTVEVAAPPGESDELGANPDFLGRLAERSGGRLIRAEEIPDIVRSFAPRVEVVQDAAPVWEPAWDRSWVLVMLIGLFAAEWTLRRRHGML